MSSEVVSEQRSGVNAWKSCARSVGRGGPQRVETQRQENSPLANGLPLLDPGSLWKWVPSRAPGPAFGPAARTAGRRCSHRLWHHRRPAGYVFSQDFTVMGGCRSGPCRKICRLMDLAVQNGPHRGPERQRRCPHPGRRGVAGRVCRIFLCNTLASGDSAVSAIMGPCAEARSTHRRSPTRGHVYRHSHVRHRARCGPIRDARGVTFEELGGNGRASTSGGPTPGAGREDCWLVRLLLSYLLRTTWRSALF